MVRRARGIVRADMVTIDTSGLETIALYQLWAVDGLNGKLFPRMRLRDNDVNHHQGLAQNVCTTV